RTYICTLSLHDALPISGAAGAVLRVGERTDPALIAALAALGRQVVRARAHRVRVLGRRIVDVRRDAGLRRATHGALVVPRLRDRSEEHTSELQSRENLV